MRHMSLNLVLLNGLIALALMLIAIPGSVFAQEPEAAKPPSSPAAADGPSPLRPLPKPKPPKKIPAMFDDGAAAEATHEVGKPQTPARAAVGTLSAAEVPAEIKQFCTNNVVAAGQARVAWEAAKLKELETKLRQRIEELESKRAEYEEWLHKRDEAMKKAEEGVVAIYARMRPDAAAPQLAAMDDVMAAAFLAKLKPSVASAILNEMDPGRAARVTGAMVGGNSPADGKKS
jgi:flagellar motility protein MotE (MotC chaperone)